MTNKPSQPRLIPPDASWSLFLDRDGVINERLEGDYVKTWAQFTFKPGVTEALKSLQPLFRRIFVVTNQQGIGKGFMSHETLANINRQMIQEIEFGGGRIDKVYYCPDLEGSGSLFRKPNIGMALQARKEFPEIRLKHSVMAGDSLSDMMFGKRAGMVTVHISPDNEQSRRYPQWIDMVFPDLPSFFNYLIIK